MNIAVSPVNGGGSHGGGVPGDNPDDGGGVEDPDDGGVGNGDGTGDDCGPTGGTDDDCGAPPDDGGGVPPGDGHHGDHSTHNIKDIIKDKANKALDKYISAGGEHSQLAQKIKDRLNGNGGGGCSGCG